MRRPSSTQLRLEDSTGSGTSRTPGLESVKWRTSQRSVSGVQVSPLVLVPEAVTDVSRRSPSSQGQADSEERLSSSRARRARTVGSVSLPAWRTATHVLCQPQYSVPILRADDAFGLMLPWYVRTCLRQLGSSRTLTATTLVVLQQPLNGRARDSYALTLASPHDQELRLRPACRASNAQLTCR